MGSGKSGGTKTFYGTMLYGLGLGPLKRVRCIKSDSVTVWKSIPGVEITGDFVTLSTDVGTARIYKGSWTQSPSDLSYFADGPAYRGRAYAILINWKLGAERTAEPAIEIEGDWGDCDDDGLVSPASVIQELLCDSRIGLGAATGNFSCDSDVVDATRILAPKIADETTLQDLCDDLLPLVWCYARFEGPVLTIRRLFAPPADWESADIPEFSIDNCLEEPQMTPETPEERVITTVVNWTENYDADEGDDTEGEYANCAIWRDVGSPESGGKQTTVQADAIIDSAHASAYAVAKGHQLALPGVTGHLVYPLDLYPLESTIYMAPIRDKDRISGKRIRARVTSRIIAADGISVELEWMRDYTSSIHDEAALGYETPTFSTLAPVDPRAVEIVELPRPLAGQAAVGILCARGSIVVNGFGGYLSLDAGANWTYIGNWGAFAVYGVLQSALTISDGSVVAESVTVDADLLASVSTAQAEADTILGFIGTPPNHEIVSISTITQGSGQLTLSILRGRLGTAPRVHAAGATIYLIAKSALPIVTSPITEPSPIVNAATEPTGGTSYLFRLPQRVALKAQLQDDCDDVPVTVSGEYSRPLPPESVAATSGTTYTGADMGFIVTPTTWADEGYPGADFYGVDDVYVVPVLVVETTRTVLPARAKGSTSVTVTASEIGAAIGALTTGTFDIQFYSFVSGRHSRTGTSTTITITL